MPNRPFHYFIFPSLLLFTHFMFIFCFEKWNINSIMNELMKCILLYFFLFARNLHSIYIKCLIIGVRKCGTRALLEMLNLHPRIQKAAGEVHFFDRDENYLKGLEWYRKKMPHSFRGQITIEKSPSYFVTPEVSRPFTLLTYIRWK